MSWEYSENILVQNSAGNLWPQRNQPRQAFCLNMTGFSFASA